MYFRPWYVYRATSGAVPAIIVLVLALALVHAVIVLVQTVVTLAATALAIVGAVALAVPQSRPVIGRALVVLGQAYRERRGQQRMRPAGGGVRSHHRTRV